MPRLARKVLANTGEVQAQAAYPQARLRMAAACKPSAKPTQIRTLDLPPPTKTAPDQRVGQRSRGSAWVGVCPAVSGPDRAAAAGSGEYAAKYRSDRASPQGGCDPSTTSYCRSSTVWYRGSGAAGLRQCRKRRRVSERPVKEWNDLVKYRKGARCDHSCGNRTSCS